MYFCLGNHSFLVVFVSGKLYSLFKNKIKVYKMKMIYAPIVLDRFLHPFLSQEDKLVHLAELLSFFFL